MEKLGAELEGKALRSSIMSATLPVVREMQAAAPKGDDTHRTYKGRLVAPGFLSRSVKRKARIDKRRGTVSVAIGVKAEAYYGVTFLDAGLYVTQRKGKPINPYRVSASHWFQFVFVRREGQMVSLLRQKLAAKIERLKA